MSYKVKTVSSFDREAKKISRKHPSIKSDIAKLISNLEENPRLGTDLGQNIYKIRLAVSDTNKGKSGGARVITGCSGCSAGHPEFADNTCFKPALFSLTVFKINLLYTINKSLHAFFPEKGQAY